MNARTWNALILSLLTVVPAAAQQPAAPAAPAVPAQPAARPGPTLPPQGPTWQDLTQGKKVSAPPVTLEPEVIELGDVPINTKISRIVRMTNTGSETLTIEGVMSTCWCTAGEPSSRVIEPGQTTELAVTFDSGPYLQTAERQVVIRFAGYTRAVSPIVRASVNYGIRAVVSYDPPDQRRIGLVRLESATGSAFDVLSADGRPPEFADGFDPERDDPRTTYTIRWDLSRYEAERIPPFFVIETSDESSPLIDLPVENLEWERPRMLRPWQFADLRAMLGRLDPATDKDIVVTMAPFTTPAIDAIENVWVDPPIADVRVMGTEGTPTGLKVRLRVTPRDDLRGPLFAEVRIAATGHQESFWLIGRIAEPPHGGSDPSPVPMQ